MIDLKLPIELPPFDVSSLLPLLALVILGALILLALTARTLIASRAFTVIVVAAIIILGSATIVGGLQAIALLIAVAGLVAIGLIVTLGRQREVLDMVRTVVDRRTAQLPPSQPPVTLIDTQRQQPSTTYQLPAAGQTSMPRRRARSIRLPRHLGF
ncbi:MAG: hypothetical protein HY870_05440 [Chloroflexi bacterium]|nr:hypothetical protein [Chloroflexota bacterium]